MYRAVDARHAGRAVHCFTSITLAYLPRARVLAESLRRHHPDWVLHLVLVEPAPDWLRADPGPFDDVLGFGDLDLPGGPAWMFVHDVVEACTAVKGAALDALLRRDDTAAVVYLDPDIAVFRPLEPVLAALQQGSIVLTPHLLTPEHSPRGVYENEVTALAHGTFNLGFVAVAADDAGRAFGRWWRERLIDHCFDDRMAGLFTDQRWIDLVPSLFPEHHILRDVGCNVGPWNISSRPVARADDGADGGGAWTIGDTPLSFFHFSGWDAPGRAMLDRHGSSAAVYELWDWYGEQVAAAGQAELGAAPWAYGMFADGTPISKPMRVAYRETAELRARYRDPFDVAVADNFLRWWDTGAARRG